MNDLKKLEAIQIVYERLNQCTSVSVEESKRLSDYLWLAMTGTGGPTKSEASPDQSSANTLLPVAPDDCPVTAAIINAHDSGRTKPIPPQAETTRDDSIGPRCAECGEWCESCQNGKNKKEQGEGNEVGK